MVAGATDGAEGDDHGWKSARRVQLGWKARARWGRRVGLGE